MAAAQKDKEPRKVRRSSFGRRMGMYYISPIRIGIFRTIRGFIGLIICLVLGVFLLSGGVNQGKTVRNLADRVVYAGHAIGGFFSDMWNGDGPISVSSEGIYFADAEVPDEGEFASEYGTPNMDAFDNLRAGGHDDGEGVGEGGSNDVSGDAMGNGDAAE